MDCGDVMPGGNCGVQTTAQSQPNLMNVEWYNTAERSADKEESLQFSIIECSVFLVNRNVSVSFS